MFAPSADGLATVVPVDSKQSERALRQLEQRMMKAVAERDLSWLERHLGEEFALTTGRPGAEIRTRAEWLAVTRDRYVIESFEFTTIDVRTYGHVAVVGVRYRQTGSLDGQDRSSEYLLTDVWIRRKGRWQLVSRHSTALSAAASGGGSPRH
jgi:Domain of unknown function (DUF4440)